MSDTATIYSDDPDMDTLGGRLSRARDALGMTPAQLARRIGVQNATLQAWERDRAQPRANRLSMLAGVLNVSLSWLLHGVGTAPNEDSHVDTIHAVQVHLAELKRLHGQTAIVISQLEAELQRVTTQGDNAQSLG